MTMLMLIRTEKLIDYNIFKITKVTNDIRRIEIQNSINSDLMSAIEKQKNHKLCIQNNYILKITTH